jgi:hypothetical protein
MLLLDFTGRWIQKPQTSLHNLLLEYKPASLYNIKQNLAQSGLAVTTCHQHHKLILVLRPPIKSQLLSGVRGEWFPPLPLQTPTSNLHCAVALTTNSTSICYYRKVCVFSLLGWPKQFKKLFSYLPQLQRNRIHFYATDSTVICVHGMLCSWRTTQRNQTVLHTRNYSACFTACVRRSCACMSTVCVYFWFTSPFHVWNDCNCSCFNQSTSHI